MSNCIKLTAVGDISFGDFPFCPGFGIRSTLERSPFEEVSNLLKWGDIVFGNLETCLSNHGLDNNQLISLEMRGKPEFVSFLGEGGFNVLNMANNHTMQHGMTAFSETVKRLKKTGIHVVGLCNQAVNPVIVQCKGRTVGFLGFAFEHDNYGNTSLGYAYAPNSSIKRDIESLRQHVDIVIVSCHWGLEFINKPSPYTVFMGRKMIDWGADIVLGHHPHVVQGAEYYKNGLIVYSLGNFLFDMLWDEKLRKSLILLINIDEKISYKIIPIFVSNNYTIKPYPDLKEFLSYFRQLCNYVHEYGQYWDWERKSLQYYNEYLYWLRINRYKSYIYFLKNFYKVKPKLFVQIVNRSLKRRLLHLK